MPPGFESKSRRFLGVRRQHWIKGFFGGSALISSVMIFLISAFLIYEAIRFFPSHREELALARRSGQEYVDHLIRESKLGQEALGLFRQSYYRERDARFRSKVGFVEGFEAFEERVEELAEDEIERLAEAEESDDLLIREKARRVFGAKLEGVVAETERSEIDTFGRLEGDDRTWQQLVEIVRGHDFVEGGQPEKIVALESEINRGMAPWKEAMTLASNAVAPLDRLRERLVKAALAIRNEDGNADIQTRIQVIKEAHDEHIEAVERLKEGMSEAIDRLPQNGSSVEVDQLLEEIREGRARLFERLDESVELSGRWNWREEVGLGDSVSAFLFGKEWRAGSGWRQMFGLLPLISGSLLVSVVAMGVAVPFALGAAIYVNQLASRGEQALIKPAIEMIQAIPSVVLGFFGVMVLGDLLMEWSKSPWLSWLPGFPIEERLNLLNAGILLAFMAVPTVFTLCEDALHQVPRSLSEASLALGASKIRTVGQVVIPAASSGMVAAFLLGFGRVIGETMVVLLVAGNRVAMPDWSAGPGVVTQPGHTMTGVIAQEMGRDMGDLHYRALFLLGLILFVISLCVHLGAQRFVKKRVRYA